MNEVFRTFHRVRFGECDHAGIVFYPRYGVVHPLVRLEMEFLRPSRYSELLEFSLQVLHLGHTSLTVRIDARCNDEERVRMKLKMVNASLHPLRPVPMPDELRASFARFLIAPAVDVAP